MDTIPQKVCIACNNPFPATTEYFTCESANKDRLSYRCKLCAREKAKEYRKLPHVKAQRKAYQKSYNERPDVKERYAAYHQVYNPQYLERPGVRERYQVHWSRKYISRHGIAGTYTAKQIRDLLKRQKHKCYYCLAKFEKRNGKYIYEIEHTFPLSRVVGTDIPANDISYIVLACPDCNNTKRDKFPWEWPEGGRLL